MIALDWPRSCQHHSTSRCHHRPLWHGSASCGSDYLNSFFSLKMPENARLDWVPRTISAKTGVKGGFSTKKIKKLGG